MITKRRMIKELNDVAALIINHKLRARVELYRDEDGILHLYFFHFDNRYQHNNSFVVIYNFYDEDDICTWRRKIEEVIEGDLLDD